MQKVKMENIILDLQIFINGVPNLNLVPKEEIESMATILELLMTDYYKSENETKE